MDSTDLSDFTTGQLLVEVFSRFDHAIFGGIRERTSRDSGNSGKIAVSRRWKGNAVTAEGLCSSLSFHIERNWSDRCDGLDQVDDDMDDHA